MQRWRSRLFFSKLVGLAAFFLPIAAAVVTALVTARILPAGNQLLEIALWWVAVVGSSLIAMSLASRLMRKLLPLSILLRMALVFPDRAPSRYRVALRTWSTRKLAEDVRRARLGQAPDDATEAAEVVLSLIAALGAHDRRSRGHSERTRAYTDVISEQLALGQHDRERLRWAALIHDVGKLAVSRSILLKEDHLNESDWARIERHPEVGWKLAEPLHEFLGEWAETILHHHERWNGTGYPFGLAGGSIALGARIVAVADAYDAMTAARSYQPARSSKAARKELAYRAGTQFDPQIVRAFLNVSVGKLRFIAGPLAVLAQIPVASLLRRVSPAAGAVATAMAVVVATAAAGAIEVPSLAAEQAASVLGQTLTAAQVEIDPGAGDPSLDRSSVTVVTPPSAGLVEVTPAGTLLYTAPAGFTGSDTIEYGACRSDDSCYQAVIQLLMSGSSPPALMLSPPFVEAIGPDGTHVPSLFAQAEAGREANAATADSPEVISTSDGADPSADPSNPALAGTDGATPVVTTSTVPVATTTPLTTTTLTTTTTMVAVSSTTTTPPTTSPPPTTVPTTVPPTTANIAPDAIDDIVITNEDEVALIMVLANDIDSNLDPTTLIVSEVPNKGVATVSAGEISYVPELDFSGPDQFKYTVCDVFNQCDQARVDITVASVNDAPVAEPDSVSTDRLNKKVTIQVQDNDSDVDSTSLTIAFFDTTSALGGTVSCTNVCQWTPPSGWDGTADTFTYQLSDGLAMSASATVTITYIP